MDALSLHRFHFAFTISFHYLFPQLTMGLALLIFLMKTRDLCAPSEGLRRSVRFWTRIFGLAFLMGVLTGFPMQFQLGSNWGRFSRATGEVIGQTLAMETVFAFFLESVFLGILLAGEERVGRRLHWFASLMVLAGAWLSAFFILATHAWMQHPVGHRVNAEGVFELTDLGALFSNPWFLWELPHTLLGSLLTASTVMASIASFYLLQRRFEDLAGTWIRLALPLGFVSALGLAFPTGDFQARNVALYQPPTLAAMEGLFETREGAPLVLLGQPDLRARRFDNPIPVPGLLSFLTWHRWGAEVQGLDAFPEEVWPTEIPLLYYAYHIMVGLGTVFLACFAGTWWFLWRGRFFGSRGLYWVLLLLLPFPFIANTAGWLSAELGRQPWLVYGLMRTSEGSSRLVSPGNTLFSLLGFMGLYLVLGVLFLFLVRRELERGVEA